MQNFLELQFLVDNLVDFCRMINVNQFLFILNVLFDEVDRGLEHKKHILLEIYHLYRFLRKPLMDDLNQWVIVTLAENNHSTEINDYVWKIKRVGFLLQAKQ